MKYDRKFEYQLGFFMAPGDGSDMKIPKDQILQLGKYFEEQPAGEALKIKFGDPSLEEGLLGLGTQLVPVTTVTWTGGIWRLVWTPLRMDIYADAQLQATIAEKTLPLPAVIKRVLPGLRKAAGSLAGLKLLAHRLVLATTGEASLEAEKRESLALVADKFHSSDVREGVAKGDVWDIGARVDWGKTMDLGPEKAVPIHRIESVNTQLSFTGVTPVLNLRAQWDLNTSPRRGTSAISFESFEPFFTDSAAWISDRQRRLGIEAP